MVGTYHLPVLADAVVSFMADAPPGVLVDGTLGGGGHLAALLARLGATHRLVGVDRDRDALEAARARLGDAPVTFIHGDFRDLPALLADALGDGVRVSGVLLDLGVSSWQLDAPARGFAIKHPEGPLDMRMDQRDGAGPSALELLRSLDAGALARLLRELGEVRGAGAIARRLVEAVAAGRVGTTGDLAREVAAVQKPVHDRRGGHIHPATQVFQALRIAVNDELGALDQALAAAPGLLVDGGRLVVISYHSLEDRRVKHAFRLGERGPERPPRMPLPPGWAPTWRALTRKAVEADAAEVRANPRARSARLRAAARAPRPGGTR